MRIRYVGPFEAVDVPLPSGVAVTVAQDDVCDFPDDMAERMLEQDTWAAEDQPATPDPEPVSSDPATPDGDSQ